MPKKISLKPPSNRLNYSTRENGNEREHQNIAFLYTLTMRTGNGYHVFECDGIITFHCRDAPGYIRTMNADVTIMNKL